METPTSFKTKFDAVMWIVETYPQQDESNDEYELFIDKKLSELTIEESLFDDLVNAQYDDREL